MNRSDPLVLYRCLYSTDACVAMRAAESVRQRIDSNEKITVQYIQTGISTGQLQAFLGLPKCILNSR